MKGWFKTTATSKFNILNAAPKSPKKKDMKAWYHQQDLEHIQSIFLSTGENLNDDEFDPEEVLKALHTIPNKPINKQHKDTQIVGHMFNVFIMDKAGNMVKAGLEYDKYFAGMTSKSSPASNDHNHTWTIILDSDGKVLSGYTSWDNGHRHQISAASAKNGKTNPGGVGNHTHELLEDNYQLEYKKVIPDYKTDLEQVRDNVVIASEGETSTLPEMPKEFHVVDEGVLYKGIHGDYIADIKEKAAKGEAFVSMETYFRNYDYNVGGKLVQRNSETSFLDNFLRANGGEGNFDGNKVTRVLRDLHFAGKGIVDVPANPDSVIFASKTENEDKKVMSQVDVKNLWDKINQNCVEYNVENKVDNKVVANKQGDMMENKETTKEATPVATVNVEAEKIKKELDSASASIVKKDLEISDLVKKVEALTKEVAEAKAKAEASDKELKDIKTAQVVATRKADFAAFEISEDDLKDVLEEVKSLDDAAYAKYLAKAKRLFKSKATQVAAPVAPVVPETKPEVKTDEQNAAVAEKAVANALANKETKPLQGSGSTDTNLTVASKLADSIFGKTKEKK